MCVRTSGTISENVVETRDAIAVRIKRRRDQMNSGRCLQSIESIRDRKNTYFYSFDSMAGWLAVGWEFRSIFLFFELFW